MEREFSLIFRHCCAPQWVSFSRRQSETVPLLRGVQRKMMISAYFSRDTTKMRRSWRVRLRAGRDPETSGRVDKNASPASLWSPSREEFSPTRLPTRDLRNGRDCTSRSSYCRDAAAIYRQRVGRLRVSYATRYHSYIVSRCPVQSVYLLAHANRQQHRDSAMSACCRLLDIDIE
jgi:hypothetical protein